MTILIITKEHKTRVRLGYLLQRMDFTDIEYFESVGTAMVGLSNIKRKKLKLILFEETCTQSNKEDFFGRISILHEWCTVPIVLITAEIKNEVIERAFFAGIFDFILKPIDPTYFQTRVHIALKFNKESSQRKNQEDMLKKDLQIAKNVQKSALTPALHMDHIQLDGFYLTSNTLGGDMYCWFKVSDHKTAVILYDVMGHGVAASLITMSIRSLLRGMMTRLADPKLVIQDLNRHIHGLFKEDTMDQYLVTAIYLLIDTKEKKISYVNAGHPAGFVISESGDVQRLKSNAPILGLLQKVDIEKQEILYTERKRIILYTDGLQQENEPLQMTYFNRYSSGSNEVDLNSYVTNNHLNTLLHKDDISIVFITVT